MYKAWNKNLTKETDERVRKQSLWKVGKTKENCAFVRRQSETLKEGYRVGRIKVEHSEVTRKKIGEKLRRSVWIIKECFNCGSYFSIRLLDVVNRGYGKYCSKGCQYESMSYRSDGGKWWLTNPEAARRLSERNKVMNSKIFKEYWASEEWADRQVELIFRGLMKKPSSYEEKLIYLKDKYKLDYMYTGSGKGMVVMGRKSPDFMNTNGLKIILESYSLGHLGNFKPLDYEEVRSKHFGKYGYKVIFFNEDDLFRPDWEEHCLEKIKSSENDKS